MGGKGSKEIEVPLQLEGSGFLRRQLGRQGFGGKIPGDCSWDKAGLRGNYALRGKALPDNHLYAPKLRRKSNNIERKRRESNLAKERSRSENQGVTNLPPLEKSRPRDFRAYLPAKGTCLCAAPRIHPSSCLHRFTGPLTVSSVDLVLSFQTVALDPSLFPVGCNFCPGGLLPEVGG